RAHCPSARLRNGAEGYRIEVNWCVWIWQKRLGREPKLSDLAGVGRNVARVQHVVRSPANGGVWNFMPGERDIERPGCQNLKREGQGVYRQSSDLGDRARYEQ